MLKIIEKVSKLRSKGTCSGRPLFSKREVRFKVTVEMKIKFALFERTLKITKIYTHLFHTSTFEKLKILG